MGDSVLAAIDVDRRELIRRNHTATHLLDAALKQVLGDHVNQAGSQLDDHRLRFDFTHFEAVSTDELARIEDIVNREIFAAKPVVTRVMGIDEARASGAVALFGEKYGDVVRVVSVGEEERPFSRELCGGTHARNTAEIGLFRIVSESSTGSNVRRIEAVTSMGAMKYLEEKERMLTLAASALKCRDDEVVDRVAALQQSLHDANQKLKAALTGGASDAIGSAVDNAQDMGSYKLVIAQLSGLEGAELRNVWDTIRQKVAGPAACVLATVTEKGHARASRRRHRRGRLPPGSRRATSSRRSLRASTDAAAAARPWPRPAARTHPVSRPRSMRLAPSSACRPWSRSRST